VALVGGEGLHTADGASVIDHVGVDLVISAGGGSDRVGLEELIAAGVPAPSRQAHADDLVGLAYSSGTTGLPKGAKRTHRMRVASGRAMRDSVLAGAGSEALYLHAGPVIHTSGLFVLPVLELGGRQLLLDHARPAEVAQIVRDRAVTHLAVVPTVLAALAALPDMSREWFSSVEALAYAGAPIRAEQLRRVHDVVSPRLVQYYGLVEAMPPLTVLSVEDHRRAVEGEPELATSAGSVLPHVELQMRGASADEPMGELAVRGDVVTPGYWNAEGRSDIGKAFDDGWLLTGDVGRLDDGYLWLTDRRNDMIISGGYNIYPREIEEVVATVPGIIECSALGLPDDVWGQRLVVAVTVRDADADGSVDRVKDACGALAPHKRPKHVHVLEAMPLGATGKIDRRALAALLAT
jgi:acyl-CoA synthetase (AMP-forming)/AMP-acid ligase II